jgi:hypothetical protein
LAWAQLESVLITNVIVLAICVIVFTVLHYRPTFQPVFAPLTMPIYWNEEPEKDGA